MNEKKDLVTGLKVSFTFKEQTLSGTILLVYPDALPSGISFTPITLLLIKDDNEKLYHIKPVNLIEVLN